MGRYQTTPYVLKGVFHWKDAFLDGTGDFKCDVGSSAWFLWLDGDGHTTFYYDNVVMDFTARREKRRNQWVWYAYKKANGRTYKSYLGPSHLVNQERLDQAAEKLYQKT